MKITDAETWPTSSGKAYLLRYLKGEKLTQRQAILANCCSCLCGYVDGRYSCEDADCPLFPYMPYRNHKRPVEVEEPGQGEISSVGCHHGHILRQRKGYFRPMRVLHNQTVDESTAGRYR